MVDAVHHSLYAIWRDVLKVGCAPNYSLYFFFSVCADEYAHGVKLFEYHVGISSDDDEVLTHIGYFSYDISLSYEQLDVYCLLGIKSRAERAAVGYRDVLPPMVAENALDVMFIESALFCDGGYDFPVIIIRSEYVAQSFAEFSSAASELAAYGYNSHKSSLQRNLYALY